MQITTRETKVLLILQKMAKDVAPVNNARLASAVVLRGEILSFGMNMMVTHPFQAKYGKNYMSSFWHAETNAIFNALKMVSEDVLSRASLLTVRVKYESSSRRNFILGLAKPCEGCQKCIERFGIKRVVYSDNNGFVCN